MDLGLVQWHNFRKNTGNIFSWFNFLFPKEHCLLHCRPKLRQALELLVGRRLSPGHWHGVGQPKHDWLGQVVPHMDKQGPHNRGCRPRSYGVLPSGLLSLGWKSWFCADGHWWVPRSPLQHTTSLNSAMLRSPHSSHPRNSEEKTKQDFVPPRGHCTDWTWHYKAHTGPGWYPHCPCCGE